MAGPYSITFLSGNIRVPFDVAIVDDSILESDENFILTVDPSSLTNSRVTVGSPSDSTITIMDDDGKQTSVL